MVSCTLHLRLSLACQSPQGLMEHQNILKSFYADHATKVGAANRRPEYHVIEMYLDVFGA